MKEYANLKAHGRALFFATRDWIEDSDDALCDVARGHLFEVLDASRTMLLAPTSELPKNEQRVYASFSTLSRYVNSLRQRGLPSGEASRCNQFISKMMISFESLKHVYQYRTPMTLRAYSKIFIYILPVLLGPYFAFQAEEYSPELAYVVPVLLSVILVSLDNIQEHLENPFDQIGEDDVMVNAEKFAASLAPGTLSSSALALRPGSD